jgi:predicted TIM-barrel fold metal-dependent hydrolase
MALFNLPSFCNCGQTHTQVSRRSLLAGGASALALGAAGAGQFVASAAAQQMAAPAVKPHRIDVHHHVSPPTWLDAVKSMKQDNPPMANWSIQKTIDDMDKAGVAVSITSPTAPQVVGMNAEQAARLCRESNEYAKKLESDYKGRFGTWAMIPMQYPDAALKEIEYAFDTLKVDGVGIMTSYEGKWLGYPEFEPIWQELNRRKATVYTHPLSPSCCVNLVKGVYDPLIEYGTDTTRSIYTIIFSGFGKKYSDINWIWSHGGGSLTSFYERFTVQSLMTPPYKDKFSRADVDEQIKRFYYDVAAIPNDVTLAALPKMVPVSQIVFGSDFPYRRSIEYIEALQRNFKPDELKQIDRENALRLVPRFRTA